MAPSADGDPDGEAMANLFAIPDDAFNGLQGAPAATQLIGELTSNAQGASASTVPQSKVPTANWLTTCQDGQVRCAYQHVVTKAWVCPECSYSSDQLDGLKSHVEKCPAMGEFDLSRALTSRCIYLDTINGALICLICSSAFNGDKNHGAAHFNFPGHIPDGGKQWTKISDCLAETGFTFITPKSLPSLAAGTVHPALPFLEGRRCSACDEAFASETSAKGHIKSSHGNNPAAAMVPANIQRWIYRGNCWLVQPSNGPDVQAAELVNGSVEPTSLVDWFHVQIKAKNHRLSTSVIPGPSTDTSSDNTLDHRIGWQKRLANVDIKKCKQDLFQPLPQHAQEKLDLAMEFMLGTLMSIKSKVGPMALRSIILYSMKGNASNERLDPLGLSEDTTRTYVSATLKLLACMLIAHTIPEDKATERSWGSVYQGFHSMDQETKRFFIDFKGWINESSNDLASGAALLERLLEALFASQFADLFAPSAGPLITFATIAAMDAESCSLTAPGHFAKYVLSGLVWMAALLGVRYLDVGPVASQTVDHHSTLLHPSLKEYMSAISTSKSSTMEIFEWRASAHYVVESTSDADAAIWSADGSSFSLLGSTWQLSDLATVGAKLLHLLEQKLLRIVCAGGVLPNNRLPSIPLSSLQDQHADTKPGSSFLTHPANQKVLEGIPKLPHLLQGWLQLEGGSFKKEQVDFLLTLEKDFLNTLFFALALLPGAAPRGTELADFRWFNHEGRQRSFYIAPGGSTYFVLTRTKTSYRNTNLAPTRILRYLPPGLSQLLVVYLVALRPHLDILRDSQSESNPSAWAHLFVSNAYQNYNSDAIATAISTTAAAVSLPPISGPLALRKLSAVLSSTVADSNRFADVLTLEEVALEGLLGQAGHSLRTHRVHYDRSQLTLGRVSADEGAKARVASQFWWPIFGFAEPTYHSLTEDLALRQAKYQQPHLGWIESPHSLVQQAQTLLGNSPLRPQQREALAYWATRRPKVEPSLACILPTGYGKTLIWLSSAQLAPKGTVTAVLAPLNSILFNLLDRCAQASLRAEIFHADVPVSEHVEVLLASYDAGTFDQFLNTICALHADNRLWSLVVDEIHSGILDTWRDRFAFLHRLGPVLENRPSLFLTATLAPHQLPALRSVLGLRERPAVLRTSIARPELEWRVLPPTQQNVFPTTIQAILQERLPQGKVLIIARSKDAAALYARKFQSEPAITSETQSGVDAQLHIRRFHHGLVSLLVGTSAIGVGVDLSGISTVIIAGAVFRVEEVVQFAGRIRGPGLVCILPSNDVPDALQWIITGRSCITWELTKSLDFYPATCKEIASPKPCNWCREGSLFSDDRWNYQEHITRFQNLLKMLEESPTPSLLAATASLAETLVAARAPVNQSYAAAAPSPPAVAGSATAPAAEHSLLSSSTAACDDVQHNNPPAPAAANAASASARVVAPAAVNADSASALVAAPTAANVASASARVAAPTAAAPSAVVTASAAVQVPPKTLSGLAAAVPVADEFDDEFDALDTTLVDDADPTTSAFSALNPRPPAFGQKRLREASFPEGSLLLAASLSPHCQSEYQALITQRPLSRRQDFMRNILRLVQMQPCCVVAGGAPHEHLSNGNWAKQPSYESYHRTCYTCNFPVTLHQISIDGTQGYLCKLLPPKWARKILFQLARQDALFECWFKLLRRWNPDHPWDTVEAPYLTGPASSEMPYSLFATEGFMWVKQVWSPFVLLFELIGFLHSQHANKRLHIAK